MASKSVNIVLISLLVCVLVTSQADAQLSGVISISGQVLCSLNGNIVANATTPTPPFPNAVVQVSCGGNAVASVLTNANGVFNILLNPLQFVVTSLVSSCNLVVASPLSNCNATLPATGTLQSPLQLLGTFLRGLFPVVNLAPLAFHLIGIS